MRDTVKCRITSYNVCYTKLLRIPLFGRIIAVADAFDAMTSDRPYRAGLDRQTALNILEEGRGTQWDPYFVALFVERMRRDGFDEYTSARITSYNVCYTKLLRLWRNDRALSVLDTNLSFRFVRADCL